MEIETMDLKDLKSVAYDIVASIQKLQNDLMVVNQQITKKTEESKNIVKEETKK